MPFYSGKKALRKSLIGYAGRVPLYTPTPARSLTKISYCENLEKIGSGEAKPN